MLKMTGIGLELLTDIDLHLFIEAGVRGGIGIIPNRYAKANNPYMPEYDTQKPHHYLFYLDCTNLYGTAMRQPLPHSGSLFFERGKIDALELHTVGKNDEIGYVLHCDFDYPQRLHDLHSDYPLAAE